MYRKAWCTCKPVVLLHKPIALLTVSLPSPSSLPKLPTNSSLGHRIPLSSSQASLCGRETGEGEKLSARGTMGRKTSGTAFPPSHRPPRALLFLLEYPAGAYAVERDKVPKKIEFPRSCSSSCLYWSWVFDFIFKNKFQAGRLNSHAQVYGFLKGHVKRPKKSKELVKTDNRMFFLISREEWRNWKARFILPVTRTRFSKKFR